MSFFGTWAVYMETILERGRGGWPFWRNPSRYLPTITSACELWRYSVTTAAMRLGGVAGAAAESEAPAAARNSLRVCIASSYAAPEKVTGAAWPAKRIARWLAERLL